MFNVMAVIKCVWMALGSQISLKITNSSSSLSATAIVFHAFLPKGLE